MAAPLTIPLLEILQAAVRCQQAGQFQDAEALCNRVCAAAPTQPDALHLLAVISAQTGRYRAANEYFIKAIASDPLRADFHGNYGNALWEQGCIDEAIDQCQRAIALNANNAEVYNVLGNAHLSQNQPEEAAADFRKALELRPAYPHALNNLGNALQRMGKADEAISFYRQALDLQADYPEACYNLGRALQHQGKISEAGKYFRKALELRPDYRQVSWSLAEVDPVWLEPLDGGRLHLRRYREEDAAYLRQCYQNLDFMAKYNHSIPHHQRVEDLKRKLRQTQDTHPCQSKSVDWIILRKSTGQPVGIANLVEIQFAHRRAEFLIGLPEEADRARGSGIEATLLVLDYAFNKVGLNKVTTFVYGDNTLSQQILLALGFVQESHLREQIVDQVNGRFLDLYGSGMTQGDFRANTRLSKLSRRMLRRDITLTASISKYLRSKS